MTSEALFSRTVRVEAVLKDGLTRTIEADPAERAALAELNRLPGVAKLTATFTLRRAGRAGVRVSGVVHAEVTQTCVVSLEPFPATLDESVDVRFAPSADGSAARHGAPGALPMRSSLTRRTRPIRSSTAGSISARWRPSSWRWGSIPIRASLARSSRRPRTSPARARRRRRASRPRRAERRRNSVAARFDVGRGRKSFSTRELFNPHQCAARKTGLPNAQQIITMMHRQPEFRSDRGAAAGGVGLRAQSGVNMDLVIASAISIGVLGGIGAFLLLLPQVASDLSVWVALIGFATFYLCGGKEVGLGKALTQNIFGAVMGLILLLLVPLGAAIWSPLWIGICVLITLFILVIASKWAKLGDIPASLLGYAPLLAFLGKNATAVSFDNPFVIVVISLVIGAVLGYIAEKLTAALAKK